MENLVNIKINGMDLQVPSGITIMEAARSAGIRIPTLCFLKNINEIGACRICVVEVKGARALVASCVYPVAEGMEILTQSERVIKSRRQTLQLLLSVHDKKCLTCVRSSACELQALCRELGVDDAHYYEGSKPKGVYDDSIIHMIRDDDKCILCRRCVAACTQVQGLGIIGANGRGFNTTVGTPFNVPLDATSCIHCGQCIAVCPTGALRERDETDKVIAAISDPTKHVVVQTAPSVRAALGEEFGLPVGTNVEGKMVAALRRCGFEKVFNTDFGADLTIMEEANELLDRINNGGKLPMFTSCSPGWVKFLEFHYPELIPHLSSCKSPAQMQGAAIKTYWAEKNGIDPKDIVMVDIMPCTAKKFELTREGEDGAGIRDVDISLTTREAANLIRKRSIDFNYLADEAFDDPFGTGSGAGAIFGATGGVMEAALRTAVEKITGEELPKLEFDEVRGMDGIKTAEYDVGGIKVKVCVASGLANAKIVMEKVKNHEMDDYQFIEIMGCRGGCVSGGGQPRQPGYVRNNIDIRAERAKVLYDLDANIELRKSHDNQAVKQLYDDYLGEVGGEKAHHLLHTHYVERKMYDYSTGKK